MSRAYYGSKWEAPYCPGTSTYKDDLPNGGKTCSTSFNGDANFDFDIDENGKCIDSAKCVTSVSDKLRNVTRRLKRIEAAAEAS